jgi:hypothetical protein
MALQLKLMYQYRLGLHNSLSFSTPKITDHLYQMSHKLSTSSPTMVMIPCPIHSKFQPLSTMLLYWLTVPLTSLFHPLFSKMATYLPPTKVLVPSTLLITLHKYLTSRYTLLLSTKLYSSEFLLHPTITVLPPRNLPSAFRPDWFHQQAQLLSESRPTHS